MKRALITGATGYLGSNLARTLVGLGYQVAILKRRASDLTRLASILNSVVPYDLEEIELRRPFVEHGPIDVVIHTATNYGKNGEAPSELLQANTSFPLELLEVSAFFETKVFINTDTTLGKDLNAYALSKSHFREWGKFLAKEAKIKFVNLRLEHFYGPGDDEWKFPIHVIGSCMRNVPMIKLTAGEQKRDFVYIEDVTAGYTAVLEKAIEKKDSYLSYDLGSGQIVSVREFAETVRKLTSSTTVLQFGAVPYRANEVMASRSDISALRALGWSPKVDLVSGIKKTMEGISAK